MEDNQNRDVIKLPADLTLSGVSFAELARQKKTTWIRYLFNRESEKKVIIVGPTTEVALVVTQA